MYATCLNPFLSHLLSSQASWFHLSLRRRVFWTSIFYSHLDNCSPEPLIPTFSLLLSLLLLVVINHLKLVQGDRNDIGPPMCQSLEVYGQPFSQFQMYGMIWYWSSTRNQTYYCLFAPVCVFFVPFCVSCLLLLFTVEMTLFVCMSECVWACARLCVWVLCVRVVCVIFRSGGWNPGALEFHKRQNFLSIHIYY